MAEIVPLELIHVECECAFGPLGIGSAIPVPLNSTIQTNAFGLGAELVLSIAGLSDLRRSLSILSESKHRRRDLGAHAGRFNHA